MQHLRVLRWILTWTLLSLLTLISLLVATVRINRYVLRYRAEALMRNMQSISLRRTTFEEVQPVLRRWQQWGTYHGPCTAQRCTFFIELCDLNSPLNTFLYNHQRLFTLASYVGERPTVVRAVIGVIDGVVWREGIAFGIENRVWNPDGRPLVELVGGSASSTSKTEWVYLGPHWNLHPEYTIHWPTNLPNELSLDFTPFANSTEIHHLMSMNFSCLTRWTSCSTKNDIMPTAMARVAYWNSLPYDPDVWEKQCNDPTAIELFARDSPNVLLVQVVANKAVSQKIGEQTFQMRRITFRTQDALKLHSASTPESFTFVFNDPISVPPPPIALRPGARMVLFFRDTVDRWSLSGCSPTVPTSTNLAAVRRGVSEDTRPPGLPEFAFGD
jgi:hypothetical protein